MPVPPLQCTACSALMLPDAQTGRHSRQFGDLQWVYASSFASGSICILRLWTIHTSLMARRAWVAKLYILLWFCCVLLCWCFLSVACSVVAQAGSNCHLAAQAIAAALISCKGPFLTCVLTCLSPALAWLHSELMGVKWHPVAVLASNGKAQVLVQRRREKGFLLQPLAPSGAARQEDVGWWSRIGYAMGAASGSLPAVSCL